MRLQKISCYQLTYYIFNMTPKEKAKKLVEKYEKYLFNRFTTDEDWVKCIECALIAVNEILKIEWDEFEMSGDEVMYWKQVKKEIEKL